MIQKYLIGCLTLLLAFIPNSAEPKVVYIPPDVFSFRGVEDLKSPVKMELKNDKIDLSSVIQSLNRSKKSYYSDTFLFYKILHKILFPKIKKLCEQSKNKTNCTNTAKTHINSVINNINKEVSNRIFYPYWYEEQPQDFTEAMNFLNSNCTHCINSTIASLIKNNSKEQYNQIYNNLKGRNRTCIKQILTSLIDKLNTEKVPEKCLQEENKNQVVCKKLLKQIDTAKQRFFNLAKLIYTKTVLQFIKEKLICLKCPFLSKGHFDKDINSLTKTFEKLEIKNQCSKLDIGEKKQLHTSHSKYYTIKRERNGDYSGFLTLKFSPHKDDYDGPVPKEDVHGYYINKIKKCVYIANQKLLGPNGEKLRFVINSPVNKKNSCEKENTINISILSKDYHTNSGNYPSDLDCPSNIHELQHLFLPDEYRNETKGFYIDPKTGEIQNIDNILDTNIKNYKFIPAFDCRVTQVNSIMANHQERWNNVFKYKKNKSLLDPGHFYRILYGDCPYINKHFNKCAKLSLKSSIKDKNCLQETEKCETYNILRRNKQEELNQIKEKIDFLNIEILLFTFLKGMGISRVPRDLKSMEIDRDILTKKLNAVESWPDSL